MKKCFLIALAVANMLLAGCAGAHHEARQWEYKVAVVPIGPEGTYPVRAPQREQFLNQMAKDGWTFICVEGETFYFKRPKK